MRAASLGRIVTVARFELLRMMRRRRFIVILAIVLAVLGLSFGVRTALSYPYPDAPEDFLVSTVGNIDFFIIIAACLFAGDALSHEFEHRTGYFTFVQPVSRTELALGKTVAVLSSACAVIAVYFLTEFVECIAVYHELPLSAWASLGYAVLYTAAIVGIAELLGALLKRGLLATIITFLLVTFAFSALVAILSLSRINPWFVLNQAGDAMIEVLKPHDKPYDIIRVGEEPSVFEIYVYYPDPRISAAVLALYALVSLVVAIYVYRRREFV